METEPITWSHDGRDYLVRLRYRLVPRVEVDQVCITVPPGSGYPVSRVALREVPLGELAEQYRPAVEDRLTEGGDRLELFLDSEQFTEEERAALKARALGLYGGAKTGKRRGGRPPLTVQELAPYAEAYKRAWAQGRHDLWIAVQQEFPYVSPWTIQRYIKRAKEMGLIPVDIGPQTRRGTE